MKTFTNIYAKTLDERLRNLEQYIGNNFCLGDLDEKIICDKIYKLYQELVKWNRR